MANRSDPYQDRARELAIAAGLDPDSRIERPGLRSMPAWCVYRDAARAEQIAREAALAAADIAIRPQEPRFQNSPLKVFGWHDANTIAQMKNCMAVGNVVAGTICADGHLGYAQPVGGVIAYEQQISISGVGFDIACGTMAVRLDTPYTAVSDRVGEIIKDICRVISFGVGRVNEERVEHPLFDDDEAWHAADMEFYRPKAKAQLGTVGCLAGDTLIPTLGGEHRTIRDIVGRWEAEIKDEWVFSYDTSAHRIVPGRVIGAVRSGIQHCVRLTLDNGETVVATPDHPFLTLQEQYVRADALTPETSIMPLYGRERHDRPEVYQPILGYWDQVHRMVVLGTQIETFLAALVSHAQRARGTAWETAIHHWDRDKWNNYPCNLGVMSITQHNRLHSRDGADALAKLWEDPVYRQRRSAAASLLAKEQWSSETKRFAKIDGMKRAWAGNDARKAALAESLGRRDKTGEKNPNYRHGRYARNHRVVSVEDVGEREVFDLQIDIHNNFAIGAGVFVHNSGNHYVDLMRDEDGWVWIGVHFGSRGLGHTSVTRYLKAAGGKDGMNVPPAVLDEDSELGRRYIAAMHLAGRYAYAGREWVVERVRKIVGGAVTEMVHNHHNFAWREQHDGRDLWVVRKGATPAFPGQRGFVGGSMGDDAVILEGVEGPEAKASLYSTVHGAGRLFGRKEAKRRFSRAEMDAWLNRRGVTLAGADLDESPMAYRRLPEVLEAHAGSVNVLHTLRPFGVVMAGNQEEDPWKD